MFTFKLMNNHGGMILVGDFLTLGSLHTVLTDIEERSALLKGKAADVFLGLFLGLAYDVRLAQEGRKEVFQPSPLTPKIGIRFGVQILWPVLLLQQRMMRESLAFMEHKAIHQAVTYALEDVIEEALNHDFGDKAGPIIEAWKRISTTHPYAVENYSTRTAVFCSWSKAERAEKLAALLDSLNPMFEDTHMYRAQAGLPGPVDPEIFEEWEGKPWPDHRCDKPEAEPAKAAPAKSRTSP